jgi:hypothetical protein
MLPIETLPQEIREGVILAPEFFCLQRKHLALSVLYNNSSFHGEDLFAPRPNPKLEDKNLLAVRDLLFNLFAATPISEAVPPSPK